MWIFQDDSNALAGADADPDRAVAGVAFAQFDGQREDVARPGRAERVADGDRAAVGGELVVGNLESVELVREFRAARRAPGR